ncbi:hypothetical protein [Natronococcus jeotgali]|uniref:hypothetical protein n=1 Tax=Natronococcus jeotgali TaxID=413812 RepID=UPI001360B20F|nr:hypothetical protein [Natronococcus jeotgali]
MRDDGSEADYGRPRSTLETVSSARSTDVCAVTEDGDRAGSDGSGSSVASINN